MTASSSALDGLRHALPADTERSPLHYVLDGMTPAIAFEPTDPTEVATLLHLAAEGGLAVAPLGARTATGLGRPLARYDVALDLRALDRVIEYVPDDLVITVQAGATLAALETTLHEHGQYLPVDPPPGDEVTIGGLLASARSGAWRGHLPAARDLILGMQVALPSGELVHSGGRVVKNVTGYDMHRMHTGALGAFGVIVEATFKLTPLPAATRTLLLPAPDIEACGGLARRVWDAGLAVRAITVLGARAADAAMLPPVPGVLVEVAGGEAAVERTLRELHAVTPGAGEAPPEAWTRLRRLAAGPGATVLRLGVPPAEVEIVVTALERTGLTAWAHLAAGSVIARGDIAPSEVEALQTLAAERGGFLQVEVASPALRETVDPMGEERMLVEALRRQFDPHGTVNPGRWGAEL
ncbi:MAG: FAD-binding oxidoreductase [Dehalococcoidia bacterium]|nr:MAG: FAD-binding oxidoreductase [Dehalococcoidia bacterium]